MTDDQAEPGLQLPWALKLVGGESVSLITERQTLRSVTYAAMRPFFALACTLPLVFCTAAAQPPLDPLDTLKRINHNYNTLKDACQEPDTGAARGLYYCSGVTLRMVNDGPFNPWDYSPCAIRIGATSYSWIRKDLSTRILVHPAGFILRNPTDAAALNLPVKEQRWTCIYAFSGQLNELMLKNSRPPPKAGRFRPATRRPCTRNCSSDVGPTASGATTKNHRTACASNWAA